MGVFHFVNTKSGESEPNHRKKDGNTIVPISKDVWRCRTDRSLRSIDFGISSGIYFH